MIHAWCDGWPGGLQNLYWDRTRLHLSTWPQSITTPQCTVCMHIWLQLWEEKKKEILAHQSLKPNFVQSVLTHSVNHAIYFTPKLYSGMHPLLQLEFSTHTLHSEVLPFSLQNLCSEWYFSETHTAYALFSCFREIMQSALHAYVSVLWGNDSGYE